MNEEIKKPSLTKFAFYWGSIFGSVVFLYQVLSQWLHFSVFFFQTLLYSFFVVFALMYALTKYKRSVATSSVTFGKALGLLTIVSLVMSAFFALFYFVLIAKLDPTLLQDAVNQMATMMDQNGMDTEFLTNEKVYSAIQISFLFTSFFFDFVGNFFYALFISFVFTRNNTPQFNFDKDENSFSKDENKEEENQNQ